MARVSPHVLSLLAELLEGVAGLSRDGDEDLPGVSLWDGYEDRPRVPIWTRVRLGDGEEGRLQTAS